ncbi:hypothetical protein BDV12DRAFT_192950 [Aspergillus spectabilis]
MSAIDEIRVTCAVAEYVAGKPVTATVFGTHDVGMDPTAKDALISALIICTDRVVKALGLLGHPVAEPIRVQINAGLGRLLFLETAAYATIGPDHELRHGQSDIQEERSHPNEPASWAATLSIRTRSNSQSSLPGPARGPSPDGNISTHEEISYDINDYSELEKAAIWSLICMEWERRILLSLGKYGDAAQNPRPLAASKADLEFMWWKAKSSLRNKQPSDSEITDADDEADKDIDTDYAD